MSQLWPPLDGIHKQNEKLMEIRINCQEEMSVAVSQDHVTGKVFKMQPCNID